MLTVFTVGLVPVPVAAQAEPGGSAEPAPLVEHPSPIVVEAAPNAAFPGGNPAHGENDITDARLSVHQHGGHNVSPEIQEAMESHSAELRATSRTRQQTSTGLPPNNYGASFGGIAVDYDSTYSAPSSVRTVVSEAIGRWDSVLATNPSGPIVVKVFWSDLGNPSLLGYAGPDGMYYGGGLPTSSLYPAALANTLLGLDANGASRPEIQVVLNAELLDDNRWYLGTTGTPSFGQIDLFSVVLHEVGHGLGFLGSATVASGQSAPSLHSPGYVYDEVARYNGTPITAVADQGSALRSGNVTAQIADGSSYQLYAPSTWSQGSSFSHFDESAYPPGSPGAMMTPMLSSGEVARTLDSPVLGLMAATGWPTTVKATTPTITSLSPSLTSIVASWDRNLSAVGLVPDSYTVAAWRDGTVLQSSVTVSGSAATATVGSLSPGATYTVIITPNGPGGAGVATSAGVQLSSSGGPADPADWPTYIRNVPLDGQINRLYQAYFLRLADQSGFDYWVDQRARSTALLDISSAFAASAEFQNRYGSLSNEAFIDLVYANVLNRSADAEGRSYWLGQLASGVDRGAVMIGFAESPEYIARTGTLAASSSTEAKINRLYLAFFLRSPDAEGLAYWAGQAESGVALQTIAAAFAQSGEFQTRYGSLTNQQFVELVYRNVLGRDPDAGGLNYWVGQLNSGVDRGSVMVGFSESAEFIKTTGTIP